MYRNSLLLVAFLGSACVTLETAYAKRGIPIPVVWGSGEQLTELGELPPDVLSQVTSELGTSVTVAFLHERAHIFWLDLWTWNGRHVVHSGDKYWEPDPTTWQKLIGADPTAKYGKPILYRLPLLPSILAVAVFGYVVRKRFFKSEQEKLKALFKDKRYQKSIRMLFDSDKNDESPKAITTLDERRFFTAKSKLIEEGVDARFAETNLRKMAAAILANTNSRIDGALMSASQYDHLGNWEKSSEIYSQLISSLPHDDERLAYAKDRLAALNVKKMAIVSEQKERS